MTIEVQPVQRIRVYSEPTFAVDYFSSVGSFTDVPFQEGTAQMVITQEMKDPGQAVQSRLNYREEILGKRTATLTFTMPLAPTGSSAGDSITSVQSPLGLILKAVMGGEDLGAGSIATAGSTASVINVQTGDGSRWASGGAIGWVNASNVLEVREIESISSDAITVKNGFSGSPAAGSVIYNAATYYLTEDPAESLQFYVQGREVYDKWLLRGGQCVGGFTISLDPSGGSIPTVTFSFQFAEWTWKTSGGTFAPATYSNYSPIVGHAGEFRAWVNGTATYSADDDIHVSAVNFAPATSFLPVTSPSGTNTILRWRGGRLSPPITGSLQTFWDYAGAYGGRAWHLDQSVKRDLALQYRMGTTAGSTVVLSAPTVQVTNFQRTDSSGIAGQTIEWKGRHDGDAGGNTTAQALSPFRIHFF